MDAGNARTGQPVTGSEQSASGSEQPAAGPSEPAPGANAAGTSHRSYAQRSVDRRRVARMVALIAVTAAVAMFVLALVDPSPSRHLRGLLITVNLTCLVGVAGGWLRVVRAVGAPGVPGRVE